MAVVPNDLDGATVSTGFAVLRPGAGLDSRYLFHWVQSASFVADMVRKATGASYPAVSDRIVKASAIPISPLDEQRRIAEILDRADAIRAKRRQVLAHLDALVQSIFHDMFDGLGTMSAALADVSEIWDCPHSTPKWTEDGMVCLRTSNLTRGGWNWDDTRYVDPAQFDSRSKGGGSQAGDIILSREGTVGIAAIVESGMNVCMGQRLVQVRVDTEVLAPQFALAFLLEALQPERISHAMVGSTARHLNVKDLRQLAIPLPSRILQKEFASRVESIESLRSNILRAQGDDDTLFHSLQSRAFRGEL